MYRKTYALIDENVLKKNIEEIKSKYSDYSYYIGVVKNNAYGHGMRVVNALVEGGVNYLAVSSLEEAIEVRKYNQETPILCLEVIDLDYIFDCINYNVTITVESLSYLEKLNKLKLDYPITIHLKLNTGMNRLGISNQKDVEKCIELIKKNKMITLEGIYTHFATSGILDPYYDKQLRVFKELTQNIDLKSIPIVHLGRSETLVQHDKLDFVNGIRLGIVMYGFSNSRKIDRSLKGRLRSLKRNYILKKNHISKTHLTNNLNLNTAFKLYSTVMTIKEINAADFVGYGAKYIADKDAKIAIIPIGYADGVTKKFQNVVIRDKKYKIVADSMDMLMVLVDDQVKTGDKVELFGDTISVREKCRTLGCSSYHLFNYIRNRVPRIHQKGKEQTEIKY